MHRIILRILDGLEVKCPFHKLGCPETISRSFVQTHINRYCGYGFIMRPEESSSYARPLPTAPEPRTKEEIDPHFQLAQIRADPAIHDIEAEFRLGLGQYTPADRSYQAEVLYKTHLAEDVLQATRMMKTANTEGLLKAPEDPNQRQAPGRHIARLMWRIIMECSGPFEQNHLIFNS